MKTKNLSVLAAIAMVFALAFTTCSNGSTGGGRPSNSGSTVARFDLTGAKAVLASGGQTSASGRAVARAVTENGLFKLLDNDSVVSVFSRTQDMAWIAGMRGSPAETGRKDLYIQFGYSWTYKTDDGESVRIDRLIHVREDGTVVNVSDETGYGNFTLTYLANFDRKGNLYFTNSESSTSGSTIYKYDPVTGKTETLLSSDGVFGKPFPSYDGSFLLVEERNQSEVKLIPCDNPGQAFDIFDFFDNTDKDFFAFAVSGTKREVYLSSHGNYGDRGLYKLSSVNGGISKDDWELTTLIEYVGVSYVFQLYVAPDNSVWGHGFKDGVAAFFRLINKNEQSDNFSVSYGDNNGASGIVKLSASHIYFLFLVPYERWSIPRKILRLSYDNPSNVENLFDMIDFKGRDKNDIYVEEYSIAGGFLYFFGMEGATTDHDGIVGGDHFVAKINLTTFEYTEITWEEQACTAIVGW
jgi:hypothetical protein